MPTDDRAKKIWHNASALVFADHWQRKLAEEDSNAIKKMLGIRWTREDVEKIHDLEEEEGGKAMIPPKVVEWPLAAILEPTLQDSVKKTFGRKFGIDSPTWARESPDDIVELYEKPRDEFLNFVWGHVRPKVLAE